MVWPRTSVPFSDVEGYSRFIPTPAHSSLNPSAMAMISSQTKVFRLGRYSFLFFRRSFSVNVTGSSSAGKKRMRVSIEAESIGSKSTGSSRSS